MVTIFMCPFRATDMKSPPHDIVQQQRCSEHCRPVSLAPVCVGFEDEPLHQWEWQDVDGWLKDEHW